MKYLLTGTEMKRWEKKMMERYKIPSILLMERAATAVVRELMQGSYDLHKVLVVCGSGNNGGDGIAVARILRQKGISVDVYMAGNPERMTAETVLQLEMYRATKGSFVTVPTYAEYTVMVDGILGIGCNRVITGQTAKIIEEMNEAKVPVVSIDIPTGISADTGKVCGIGIKADVTVTFFSEKLGMILYPGAAYCGKILVEDLEMPFDKTEECHTIAYTEDELQLLPVRKGNSHKGSFGKVLVIAGSSKIFGAAYLAAAGAYKIGAGLVKVLTSKENKTSLQSLLPEALLEVYDGGESKTVDDALWENVFRKSMEWADVLVIGPGIGTEQIARSIFSRVLEECKVPLVIDADGINLLAENREILKQKKIPIVLTPHILEMARLCGTNKEKILESPIEAAKEFTEQYPVTLVLKDARTIVAKSDEEVYVNVSGNSGMATGGSGDVLAGMIAGLMAQGLTELQAARLGVYLHGRAGDAAKGIKGAYSMTATDVLNGIAEVTR